MGVLEAWGGGSPGIPPHAFDGSKTIQKVTAWGEHAAVLATDGSLATWGDMPASFGRFLNNVRDVDAGPDHFMYIDGAGVARGWGGDRQWSTGSSGTYTAVAAGERFSLALSTAGKVVAFGDNDKNQLNKPAALADKTVTAIATGTVHSLALTTEGKVYAWGGNGDRAATQVPADLAGVTAIDAGPWYSMAIAAGKVRVWGAAGSVANIPAALADEQVVQIAAGAHHAVALTAGGKVYAWGDETDGSNAVPAAVSKRASGAIAAGDGWSVALTRQIMMLKRPTLVLPPELGAAVGRSLGVTSESEDFGPAGAVITGYQWQRDGVDIPGATGTSYRLKGADWRTDVGAVVTVSKPGYGTDTFATTTTSVDTVGTYRTEGTPFISNGWIEPGDGYAYVDDYVTFSRAEIFPEPEVELIRWVVTDYSAPGNQRTVQEKKVGEYGARWYTPTFDDYNRHLAVEVEISGRGMEPLTYDTKYFDVWVKAGPGKVTFEGDLNVGEKVKVHWDTYPYPEVDGYWFTTRPGYDIVKYSLNDGDELLLTPDMLGKQLGYVLFTGDYYHRASVTEFPGYVGEPLIKVTTPPRIAGRPEVGSTLTVRAPVSTPAGTVTYRWLRDGEPIGAGGSTTYTVALGDLGHNFVVEATIKADGHVTATSRSTAVTIGGSPPPGTETS